MTNKHSDLPLIKLPVRKEYMWPDTSGVSQWSLVDANNRHLICGSELFEKEDEHTKMLFDKIVKALNDHDNLVRRLKESTNFLCSIRHPKTANKCNTLPWGFAQDPDFDSTAYCMGNICFIRNDGRPFPVVRLASLSHAENEAHKNHILRACNNFDALVEMVRVLLGGYEHIPDDVFGNVGDGNGHEWPLLTEMRSRAKDLLASLDAEGGDDG